MLRKPVPGLNETNLARFVTKARRAVGLRGSVNVLISGNQELRSLNARFRGKPEPTDVLSFPSLRQVAPEFAGDIAISAEIAKENARDLGNPVAEEIKVLVLHGLLHLAGYDHERDNGVMAARETQLRKVLGLPTGLIERATRHGRVARRHTNSRSAGGSERRALQRTP